MHHIDLIVSFPCYLLKMFVQSLYDCQLVYLFALPCRGNSKYHYYGIRVKPDSPLNRLQEDMQYMALRQQPVQQKQRQNILVRNSSCDTVQSCWNAEVCIVTPGSSQCRSLTVALGTITQVEASTILVQQSRQLLHRASTTSSSQVSIFFHFVCVSVELRAETS